MTEDQFKQVLAEFHNEMATKVESFMDQQLRNFQLNPQDFEQVELADVLLWFAETGMDD